MMTASCQAQHQEVPATVDDSANAPRGYGSDVDADGDEVLVEWTILADGTNQVRVVTLEA